MYIFLTYEVLNILITNSVHEIIQLIKTIFNITIRYKGKKKKMFCHRTYIKCSIIWKLRSTNIITNNIISNNIYGTYMSKIAYFRYVDKYV